MRGGQRATDLRAMALPMPRDAPVMKSVLPCREREAEAG